MANVADAFVEIRMDDEGVIPFATPTRFEVESSKSVRANLASEGDRVVRKLKAASGILHSDARTIAVDGLSSRGFGRCVQSLAKYTLSMASNI